MTDQQANQQAEWVDHAAKAKEILDNPRADAIDLAAAQVRATLALREATLNADLQRQHEFDVLRNTLDSIWSELRSGGRR